jgi:predicted dehydrogenase
MVGMTSQPSQKPQMSVLRLLEQLPPPSVEPGPATAAPLPADRPVRWGILATGKIAGGFAENLALLPDAEIAAVAARRLETAREFAARHGAGTSYVMLALEAGKPVLCEKAFTLNEAQAVELVAAARERGLFLMEAMWMRCHPLVRRLQQLLGTGELGTVRQVRADLGFRVDAPETDRLLDPALGGGALLDMGVYPLTFADLFLGEPERVATAATLSGSGIDLDVALALGYAGGAVAALTASMTAPTPRSASIATDRGRIDVPAPFHHPGVATWTPIGGTEADAESFSEDVIGTGLAHEAVEVMRCLRSGETESPLVPLDTTVTMMRLLDRVRRDIGLRYAADVD